MSHVTTRDHTRLNVKDWGTGARVIRKAQLIEYDGAPHGLFATHKEQLTGDLLTFLRG